MKKIAAALLSACLLLVMLPAAFAAERECGPITRKTTLQQLRDDPAIRGSGYYTYCREMSAAGDAYWKNKTLEEYMRPALVDDSVAAMNLVAENYRSGVQVTWQVYSPEQIAENDSLGCVQLYYFPGKNPGGKYAIVMPGNGSTMTSEMEEGGSAAYQLHELGYTVFVLRYRTWLDMTENAPIQDLSNAVKFITEHAEQFAVQPEDYAIVGFSSGGQIAGVFANREYGYEHYGAQKPGALLLAYPVASFSVAKPLYHVLFDPGSLSWKYYWTCLRDVVEPGYPPVYFWRGDNDTTIGSAYAPGQHEDFARALQANGVPYRKIYYKNAPHSIGTGNGTDAEGWVADAVAFWEEQTK